MQKTQLAIATVPLQEWGPVYDDEKALETGTIFQELDMPLFATEGMHHPHPAVPKSPQEQEQADLMKKLMQADFVLQDLTLYLDTHMDDENAIAMYKEKAKEKMEIKKEFTRKCYPLTRDCLGHSCSGEGHFCWQGGPVPWEGVCV